MTPTLPRHPRVTCPCCKGAKVLLVYDADDILYKWAIPYKCTHCQGEGTAEAEVEDDA